ncbi:MAG TPA: hypothetical protein VEU30_04015 [Thermoanaerobaculia bacterium]|nr:hypothetical protein [Thermoanaerobaculia bacterium]
MRIRNTGNEPIGADARIGAIYRATPAYLGNGSSDDTAPIVTGNLADLIPGYTGIAPGQSVTISRVRPDRLRPNDTVTQFERRVAIFASLGDEPQAVIGLVQQASRSSGPLKITGRSTFNFVHPTVYNWYFRVPSPTGGPDLYFAHVGCTEKRTSFPGSTVTLDCNAAGAVGTFTMDPVIPGLAITLDVVGCQFCGYEFQAWKGAVLLKTFRPDHGSRYRILCTDLETCKVEHLSGPGD